jgi:AcrR family transcriptional regulator
LARPIEKRADIERGVLRVIAEKGLRGTTIQDIARAAHVSPGLLYRYWKNRDDLAAHVYQTHFVTLVQKLSTLAAAESDVLEKLRVMIKAFYRFADEHPTLLKFLLLSQHDLSRTIPPEKGVRQVLRRVLEDGVAQECLRPMDSGLAMELLLGIVIQPAIGVAYGNLPRPVSTLFPEVFAAVERTLGSNGSTS